MSELLPFLLALALVTSAILTWKTRVAFWMSVTGLAAVAAAVLVIAGQTQRAPDVIVVSTFVLIGPSAFVLSMLRWRLLTRNLVVAIVSSILVFVCAVAVWLIVAVNVRAVDL